MGLSVLTKGVQGVQYSGFSSALGRRSRYSGFSSVRARVNVPFMEDRKKRTLLELLFGYGYGCWLCIQKPSHVKSLNYSHMSQLNTKKCNTKTIKVF